MKKKHTVLRILAVLAALAGAAAALYLLRRRAARKKELEDLKKEDDLFEEGEAETFVREETFLQQRTVEKTGILPPMEVKAVLSDVTLDLSEAYAAGDTYVELRPVCSRILLDVPEGVCVRPLSVSRATTIHCRCPEPAAADAPSLYVTVRGLASVVEIR